MSSIRQFMDHHFLHFNSREVVAAARAWEAHLAAGGKMFISLAGAMSTARIGRILSRLIRADMIHGISCTGANLEEDIFGLLSAPDYEVIPDWRALRAEDEAALLERGMNRVTDICIPETVMLDMDDRLRVRWKAACEAGEAKMPSEYLWELFDDEDFRRQFKLPAEESWVLAAREKGVPIFTPGWEDSSLGNAFTAFVMKGDIPRHDCIVPGTEVMARLMRWYLEHCNRAKGGPSVGFFQVGGGIAGDFAICAVPALIQDMKMEDVPYWGYFCQVSDAVTSYGGYSGAPPNEKITWAKLGVDTPKFMIQSDATIVAPLVFAYLLGD